MLGKLESISMDMVRDQDLMSKGSSKLSGTCGKLLCCLRYEVESYKDLKSNLPPMGSKIKTKSLEGRVVGMDILNQKVKVRVDERNYQTCDVKDVLNVTVMEEKHHAPPQPPEPAPEAEDADEALILSD